MQNRPQTITKARFRRFCRLVGKGMNFFWNFEAIFIKISRCGVRRRSLHGDGFRLCPPHRDTTSRRDGRRRCRQRIDRQRPQGAAPLAARTPPHEAGRRSPGAARRLRYARVAGGFAPAARLAAGAVRFAPTRHHAPQKGGRSLPRRHHERQEHRLAGLRHPQ